MYVIPLQKDGVAVFKPPGVITSSVGGVYGTSSTWGLNSHQRAAAAAGALLECASADCQGLNEALATSNINRKLTLLL
jgi:hypothetical protein